MSFEPNVGLCARCAWARIVESQKGSTFLRCNLAKEDERFAKYPPQPVLRCDGYRER